jgi:hypothetical protein
MAKQEKLKDRAAAAIQTSRPPHGDTPKMALASEIEEAGAAQRVGQNGKIDSETLELPLLHLEAAAPKINLAAIAVPQISPELPDANTDSPAAEASEPAPPEMAEESAQARVGRFTLLAACLALSAALGGMVGALTAYSLARPVRSAAITIDKITPEELQALKENVVQARVELAALKVTMDAGNRNAGTQIAKIAERLDRMERTAAEPTAKLNKAIETLDRLSRAETPVATGSIAPPQPAASANHGWVLRDVRRGVAYLEGRAGAFIEVEQGEVIPGLGRVEAIRKQDGRWVVVTPKATLPITR